MPPIVMMMFSEKCPSLHALSIYRATWIFITSHYNFAVSDYGCAGFIQAYSSSTRNDSLTILRALIPRLHDFLDTFSL